MAVQDGSGGPPVFDPSAALAGGGAAASAAAATKNPPVYWGSTKVGSQYNEDHNLPDKRTATPTIVDKTKGTDGAVADFWSWSDAERSAWGQRLQRLGVIKDPTDFNGMYSAWQDAVKAASNWYVHGSRKVTPWQAVDILAGARSDGTGSKTPRPSTQTATSRSFDIPTVEDAHALSRQVSQALLGRDPDENEMSRVASMVTAYARKHPKTTTTTQHDDGYGNTSTSSTSSGGYSASSLQDVAQNEVKADPEYGAYQASTTYYNAMLSAIGGLGSG